jgi:AcrR family transcriptional regulator
MKSALWHNLGVPHRTGRGPGRPPAAKAADTRQRIVHAAREVFSELGFDAATFQAIAARADLTRPAINHYFPSKEALYSQVVTQTNAKVITAGMHRAQGATTLLGRLSAFFSAAMDADSEDRSAAAFLVTSVLEARRHPELTAEDQDPLKASREFVSWAVHDAVTRGELATGSDIPAIVEMLVSVMWGMGFYAGYVGNHDDLGVIVDKFELLMANKLWQLAD